MTPEDLRNIRFFCERAYPFEACGFIVSGGVIPCNNVHPDARRNFIIAASDWRRSERAGILGMWHSHCDAPATPSTADVDRAQYFPYLIVEVRGGAAVHTNAYLVGNGCRGRVLVLANELLA